MLTWFRKRKAAAMQRAFEKAQAERANAERILREDDAQFHGRTLCQSDEDSYRSVIGEGWEDD